METLARVLFELDLLDADALLGLVLEPEGQLTVGCYGNPLLGDLVTRLLERKRYTAKISRGLTLWQQTLNNI